MNYNKLVLLDKAIEITKEAARSGASSLDSILKNVYQALKNLNEDVKKGE